MSVGSHFDVTQARISTSPGKLLASELAEHTTTGDLSQASHTSNSISILVPAVLINIDQSRKLGVKGVC